ncbi:hypothetical protein AWRIB429_0451 [Oenococcus oeni AWRIB429]|uniref:Uncharacterized protein n=1 Tax=Oenococcus oeni AWRIB429 TaxID=655225 RepID=D3L7X1_OENOE|nr:hypothetical protein AWRIB429_0451 [Oenococcus oeni AWRIB429]
MVYLAYIFLLIMVLFFATQFIFSQFKIVIVLLLLEKKEL